MDNEISLLYKISAKTSRYAVQIASVLKNAPIYQEISKRIPSQRTLLYFQHAIRQEIYSFVKEGMRISSDKSMLDSIPKEEKYVLAPCTGAVLLLKEV
ncbi:MAG: hypothetical protein ABIA77_03815, partial [Candidatus Omnitrophota bacterium]